MKLREIEKILDCKLGMTFGEIRGADELKLTGILELRSFNKESYEQTLFYNIPDSQYAIIEIYNERLENGEWYYSGYCVLVTKARAFEYLSKISGEISPERSYNFGLPWDWKK